MPEFFIAGFWVIDRQGSDNYNKIYELVMQHNCWIWFFPAPLSYIKSRQGYCVDKVILAGKDEESIKQLYFEVRDLIHIQDWYIPSIIETGLGLYSEEVDELILTQVQTMIKWSDSLYQISWKHNMEIQANEKRQHDLENNIGSKWKSPPTISLE